MADIPIYEEVEVNCVGCGRRFKVMRYKGSIDEEHLCNKCGGLGGGGIEDDSED